MKRTRILDCTLRDGGRIIDCKFDDSIIRGLSVGLVEAGIEIVELGFLRSKDLIDYIGNSTFFTNIRQMDAFVKEKGNVIYTAFIDYKMYDFDSLEPYRGSGVSGLRIGFTKKQYVEEKESLLNVFESIKRKGYKLFVQSVNTPGYNDKEILELIETINNIKPYSFGIVDTYGSLYLEDMTHIFDLVDHNLEAGVCIDIHSHNNMQSSFAFAQEIIRISPSDRDIIFDVTLNGMGKGAGNLNTELIIDYLNRKKIGKYNLDKILDIIDQYLAPLKTRYTWGYSIPTFMAGIYKSHPNNIIYLTEKYRLKSKDIKYIISGIEEEKRQSYDYDNISDVYRKYVSTICDDAEVLEGIKKTVAGRTVVILAPGKTVVDYEKDIINKINKDNALVISINFIPEKIKADYVFCANPIHWSRLQEVNIEENIILTSNIKDARVEHCKINYTSFIEEDSLIPDNSTIMLINLLYRVGAVKLLIAGFDGIRDNAENYVNSMFVNTGHGIPVEKGNEIISNLYRKVKRRYEDEMGIELITPSLYLEL